MNAVKISLDDYVLSGGGANGESYNHKTDPTVMLKLYFPGKIQQPLDEMLLARKVYSIGIPSPEPSEYVVTEDGRYGILFHRIPNKISYSRAIGEHPENVKQYAKEFAQMCHQLHATHIDTTQFENVKDRYHKLLAENPFFTADEKEKLSRFIDSVPDTRLRNSNGEFILNDDGSYVHGEKAVYTWPNGRSYTGYFENGRIVAVEE